MASTRRSFIERWILLNIALGFSFFYVLSTMASHPFLHGKVFRHMLTLDGVLILFPLNGIFVFGSLHFELMNKWAEHRLFWFTMMAISVAWSLGFQIIIFSYPRI
jgi:hypothetical protein